MPVAGAHIATAGAGAPAATAVAQPPQPEHVGPARGFAPIANGGALEVLFCFVFFYLVFAGAGAWSLDALWRKKF